MRSAGPSIRKRRGLLPHLTSFTSRPAGAVCYRNTMPDAQAPFVEPGYALAGSAWDAEHGADEAVDATAVPESDVGDSLDKHNRDHNHRRIVPNRSYPPDSRHCVQSICCYSDNGEYCKSGKSVTVIKSINTTTNRSSVDCVDTCLLRHCKSETPCRGGVHGARSSRMYLSFYNHMHDVPKSF